MGRVLKVCSPFTLQRLPLFCIQKWNKCIGNASRQCFVQREINVEKVVMFVLFFSEVLMLTKEKSTSCSLYGGRFAKIIQRIEHFG